MIDFPKQLEIIAFRSFGSEELRRACDHGDDSTFKTSLPLNFGINWIKMPYETRQRPEILIKILTVSVWDSNPDHLSDLSVIAATDLYRLS